MGSRSLQKTRRREDEKTRSTVGGRVSYRVVFLVFSTLVFLSSAVPFFSPLLAQEAGASVLSRALDLEGEGKCRQAIPLYRQAVSTEDPVGAVLGLERCYAQVGGSEAILPLVDSLLAHRPKDPTLRTVQLRTLTTLRRDSESAVAFTQWVALSPRDAAPFRVFARLLLDQGRAAAADTVLRDAVTAIGGTRDLAAEFAQMQGALGLWIPSARSWREASETMPYMEQAAIFSLLPVPDSMRDGVRELLLAPPVALGARRIVAGLEMRWRSAREAWRVLAVVPPDDSVVQAWIEFANEAEQHEAWLTARDAFAAAAARRPTDRALSLKAATAALTGGEPASALELVTPLAATGDSGLAATVALLQVRALAALGRAREVEALVNARGGRLDAEGRRQAQRALAWAWIRSGDLNRAKEALAAAGGGSAEDERVVAWLALYEGDLKVARGGLRRTDETSRDVVTAMALLSRTRMEYAPSVGDAFLALARGDTAGAATRFEKAAGDVSDATPFLMAVSARLWVAARDTARAMVLWQTLVDVHVESPEAAEAELDWARVLRRRGELSAAIAHLEHLILAFSQSALVPQARRELELARSGVPRASVPQARGSVSQARARSSVPQTRGSVPQARRGVSQERAREEGR